MPASTVSRSRSFGWWAAAAVFVLSVAVQYNDPDPLLWMAAYGAACAVSVAAALDRNWWAVAAGLAVVYGSWVALWLVRVASSGNWTGEEAREAGGLTLALIAMLLVALPGWRRRSRGH